MIRLTSPAFGEPAPAFIARTSANARFVFKSVGGRFIILGFYNSLSTAFGQKLQAAMLSIRPLLDDQNLCYFGVSNDPDDESQGRVADSIPGVRYFWDFDRTVSALYGAQGASGANGVSNMGSVSAIPGANAMHAVGGGADVKSGAKGGNHSDGHFHQMVYVLDPMLRVVARFDYGPDSTDFEPLLALIRSLPKIGPAYLAPLQAPVLVVPRVFEPGLCQALIDYYHRHDSEDSGFMREVDGMTVGMIDYSHKKRRDCQIEDEDLRGSCMRRIHNRLLPEIEKAFQFKANRIERYIVANYDGAEQGHFRAHRDNTTPGTAHRKFAVSLFLNSGEYEGGYLRFPEFGSALYAAPTGGAVVFSCSLLHEATPVIAGRRYMFLPFLYDEAAGKIRDQNASTIIDESELQAQKDT